MLDSLRAELIKTKGLRLLPMSMVPAVALPVLVLMSLRGALDRAAHEQIAEVPWRNGVIGDSAILAILALPTFVVLVTAVVFYVEHRNNMWKQLYATPQNPLSIYASKFFVIQVVVVASLLGALAVGILGWTLLPMEMRRVISLSDGEVRVWLATVAGELYVALLPVGILQFVLSARLRNVLHPVGVGLALTFASLLLYGGTTGRLLPYAYPGLVVMSHFTGATGAAESETHRDTAFHAPKHALGVIPLREGTILVDAAHSNRHTADDTSSAGTLNWIKGAAAEAGILSRDGRARWSPGSLRDVRLLIVAGVREGAIEAVVDSAEVTAVIDWVRAGGSLLVLTDHDPYSAALTPLAEAFGVGFSRGMVADPQHGDERVPHSNRIVFSQRNGGLGTHPITAGVRQVITYGGQGLWRTGSGSSRLLILAPTARNALANSPMDSVATEDRAQMLSFSYGAGRVVFSGETALFTAQVQGDGSSIGVGDPLADNVKLVVNTLRWLLRAGATDQ